MKFTNYFSFVITAFCFHVIKSGTLLSTKLNKIKIVMDDFYQVSAYISANFTTNFVDSFNKFPHKLYFFDKNITLLYNSSSENIIKGMYSLQESLVIFYTKNMKEVKSFVDYLIPQLTIRKRPKCLIIYSSYDLNYKDNETVAVDALKYAWKKKFLDFTVVVTNLNTKTFIDLGNFIYHLNPFNCVIYQKRLPDEDNRIFTDKLCNLHGYSIYTEWNRHTFYIKYLKRPKQKLKLDVGTYFIMNFVAKIMNSIIEIKNVTVESHIFMSEFLEKWDLDFFNVEIIGGVDYLKNNLIPTKKTLHKIVAIVSIIHTSQNKFFKMLVNVMTIFGILSICLYAFTYFETKVKFIKVFDFIKLLSGQSIEHEPQQTVERIILLTTVFATVKIMNDFLLDILLIQFEREEMPFDSFEDLYNSNLQTYTIIPYLNNQKYIKTLKNFPYLVKILNSTLIVTDVKTCFNDMKKWKNVSCIDNSYGPEVYISSFRNPDDSPSMKVANPPIFPKDTCFYWFASGSPYAMKFHEILQRVEETKLMHWPALVYKSPIIKVIEEINRVSISSGVKTEHLFPILCFGYLISIVVFFVELILLRIGKLKLSHKI